MRAYIGYSRSCGPDDGSMLVVARTSREAKPLAAPELLSWNADGWTDIAIRRLPDSALRHADPEKLATGVAHVVDDPTGCVECECWFAEPYDENGRCEACAEEAGPHPDSEAVRAPRGDTDGAHDVIEAANEPEPLL